MRQKLWMGFMVLSLVVKGQTYIAPQTGDVGVIEFFRKGRPLSLPVIQLYGGRQLELRFDVFGAKEENFYYKVRLCDYNWEPVDLDPIEYLEGFEENTFEAFSGSINTLTDYVHYRLMLPNDELNFLLPGNYMLEVYREGAEGEVVLSRKFIVFDEKVRLELSQDKFQSALYEDRQELKAKVIPGEISFGELSGNLKLMVMQNNNWGDNIVSEKYSSDGKGNIVFDLTGNLVFPGVNEFRFFDMKSLKFISERVDFIRYEPPYYHVYLKEDELLGQKQYFYKRDLSGKFFIGNQEGHDPDTLDAEYAFVHFTLNTKMPLPADIYIEGAITDWGFNDNYMTFNPETGKYEKILFLKQGLYNYRYTTREYNTEFLSWDLTEGSFYQTMNSYLGIAYYRQPGELYYQPIGVGAMETGME